jgi:hypothetical protein
MSSSIAKVVGVDNTGVDIVDSDGNERRIRAGAKYGPPE